VPSCAGKQAAQNEVDVAITAAQALPAKMTSKNHVFSRQLRLNDKLSLFELLCSDPK
jgi:hypothetical protein